MYRGINFTLGDVQNKFEDYAPIVQLFVSHCI